MAIPKINTAAQLLSQQFQSKKASNQAPEHFGDYIKQEVNHLVGTMHKAEGQSINALSGQSDINSLVTNLTDSRLAFKALLSFRREFMQAWHEIRQMQL